jgi:hypothetical protein
MPDIAMCEGTGCPMRDVCYRYTATPSEFRQSYFTDIPYNEESGECDHYWEHKDDGGCGHDQNENYHEH